MHGTTGTIDLSPLGILSPSRSESFPRDLEAATGAATSRWFSSARAALRFALADAGISGDDEVLVPGYTCRAVDLAVDAVATPAYVDVTEEYLLDLADARAKVSDRTAAIVPIHAYGKPMYMERVAAFADEHDLTVVEDAAQALALPFVDDTVGTHSDYCVFSFRFYKEATAHKGGLLLSRRSLPDPDRRAARGKRLRLLAVWGVDRALGVLPGSVYRPLYERVLSGVAEQAESDLDETGPRTCPPWVRRVLGDQTEGLPKRVETRRARAARYADRLPDGIGCPSGDGDADADGDGHTFFRYPIQVRAVDRDALRSRLQRRGVGCSRMYADTISPDGQCPTADRLAANVLTLPVHGRLSAAAVESVSEVVTDCVRDLS